MEIMKIISCVLVILAGVFFIGVGVYNMLSGTRKWVKTTAEVVGRHHYTTPNAPSHSRAARPAYREGYEKIINYTVDGKTYEKHIDDSYEGTVEIYYKEGNPDYFRTAKEHDARSSKSGLCGFFFAVGALIAVVGVFFMVA